MPFIYPTSMQFRTIEPDLLARGAADRVGLELMPVDNINEAKVRWNQEDNSFGLQHMRGLDGAPTRVARIGSVTYEYEPGVYGEFFDVTETELTIRSANMDVPSQPINVGDLVRSLDEKLIGREYDRIESSIFTLLTTGVLNIVKDGPEGTQVIFQDSYPIQNYTAPVAFSALTTASPILAFQSVQQLGYAAGHSVSFGAEATAYMNQATANNIINNQNTTDFGGRRSQYGATLNNFPGMVSYLRGQNLPQLVVYDEVYMPYAGTHISAGYVPGRPQKYIPDGKIIVVGKRPSGARLGNYLMTRNANNGFLPGSYRYVIDRANGVNGERRTPANIEIHRGHNGGPVIYYPTSVVVMSV